MEDKEISVYKLLMQLHKLLIMLSITAREFEKGNVDPELCVYIIDYARKDITSIIDWICSE